MTLRRSHPRSPSQCSLVRSTMLGSRPRDLRRHSRRYMCRSFPQEGCRSCRHRSRGRTRRYRLRKCNALSKYHMTLRRSHPRSPCSRSWVRNTAVRHRRLRKHNRFLRRTHFQQYRHTCSIGTLDSQCRFRMNRHSHPLHTPYFRSAVRRGFPLRSCRHLWVC